MNRGDRREGIFKDDRDHRRFLETLAQACEKTDWQVHAWCLMGMERQKVVKLHTDPAMGRIVKCVRKSCLHIKSFFLFFVFLLVSIFVFLPPGFGSSPLLERRCNRPGLTCYPYNDFAYTISFPIPGERAETIL